jgi:thymidylate kinase
MNRLIVVYGCHGAGKSSLAKGIMEMDGGLIECESPYGFYTKSKGERFISVGHYHSKCGGADSIKTVDLYFKSIEFLFETFKEKTIICEGIFLSALIQKPLKNFLRYKYEKGVEITQIFLYCSLGTSYRRVVERNGKIPKLKNIQNKQSQVLKTFEKFKKTKEFNCVIINTENKTKESVLKEACEKLKL